MEIPQRLHAQFVETPSVKEVILFSNTPSFLVNRLRRDNAVSYLAETLNTTEETINFLDTLVKPTNTTELLWAYVTLVSLFLRDDIGNFKDRIASIDLSHIQWGDEIRSDLLAEITPTSFQKVEYHGIGIADSHLDATNVSVEPKKLEAVR